MSKANRITVVSDRITGKARTISASELRHLRKYERKARLGKSRFTNFRTYLPFHAGDVNRIFFYLPSVKESDMAAVPFEVFKEGTPVIEATTSEVPALITEKMDGANVKKVTRKVVTRTAKTKKAKVADPVAVSG